MRSTFIYAIIATLVGLVVADQAGACNRRGRRCGDCCQPCMSRCQPACNNGWQVPCVSNCPHPIHHYVAVAPDPDCTCSINGTYCTTTNPPCATGCCYWYTNKDDKCMCGCVGEGITLAYDPMPAGKVFNLHLKNVTFGELEALFKVSAAPHNWPNIPTLKNVTVSLNRSNNFQVLGTMEDIRKKLDAYKP